MRKIKNCIVCGKQILNDKFCSHKCSAIYNNKNRNYRGSKDKRTKNGKCIICNKELQVSIFTDLNKVKCKQCKSNHKKQICKSLSNNYIEKVKYSKIYACKYCGQQKCIRKDICNKYQLIPRLVKYFNFDKSCIGTIKFYDEYDRVRKIIVDEYNNGASTIDLIKKYNHKNAGNFGKLLLSLNIKRRNLSQATSLSILNNKGKWARDYIHPRNEGYQYKHGYHTTWNNKKVFYRSSYELDYCKILDDNKIDYDMQKLTIQYLDTQLNKIRIAKPDFYLNQTNTIVQIKSDYTLDKQNMIDKVKQYKNLRYNFKLILEHKQTILENILREEDGNPSHCHCEDNEVSTRTECQIKNKDASSLRSL